MNTTDCNNTATDEMFCVVLHCTFLVHAMQYNTEWHATGGDSMICPVCGGVIDIDESKDYGECDTCMTYYYEGRVYVDPDVVEDQQDAST